MAPRFRTMRPCHAGVMQITQTSASSVTLIEPMTGNPIRREGDLRPGPARKTAGTDPRCRRHEDGRSARANRPRFRHRRRPLEGDVVLSRGCPAASGGPMETAHAARSAGYRFCPHTRIRGPVKVHATIARQRVTAMFSLSRLVSPYRLLPVAAGRSRWIDLSPRRSSVG
jgi:hypothetical protein